LHPGLVIIELLLFATERSAPTTPTQQIPKQLSSSIIGNSTPRGQHLWIPKQMPL
jgi:hypothetical protein